MQDRWTAIRAGDTSVQSTGAAFRRSLRAALAVGLAAGLALTLPVIVAKPAVADTATTTRVSVASDGSQGAHSRAPDISADGRFVAFESEFQHLADDTNGFLDVFVRDRDSGQTTRVSVASDGTPANGRNSAPAISADGRYVSFESGADNLVADDTNGVTDVFLHDRDSGQTTRVSVASDGTPANGRNAAPAISADGRYVSFESIADNLVAGDTNNNVDVFVHDRDSGQTTRVSVASDGTPANGSSEQPTISASGRHVAFASFADNLVVEQTNLRQVYVHDRDSGATTLASVATDGAQGGNQGSGSPAISAYGCYVAFESAADNLVLDDTNGVADVFVHDCDTGGLSRVSLASDGTSGNNSSRRQVISDDGRHVAYVSWADNLVADDTNGVTDVFVHDRATGQTSRVSVATDGTQGNRTSDYPAMSGDARFLAFESDATDLVANDTNGSRDVFVHDRGGVNGVNQPPTADAGADVAGDTGAAIGLDATVSDPDADALTTAWSMDSSDCTFADATAVDTTVTCASAGVYTATLTADDGINPPASDSAQVTVSDPAPPDDPYAALALARDLIGALDQSSFKARGHQVAMLSILDDVEAHLDAGQLSEAEALVAGLGSRVDGCGGEPDKHDWIIDCDDQMRARQALADLRDAILAVQ